MPEPPSPRGYPLTALFVLIAVCAVLLAMLGPVVRAALDGKIAAIHLATVFAAPASGMILLGAFVGLHHHRRLVGMALGAVTGKALGMLIGPLIVLPSHSFPSLIVAGLGGAVVLLLVGVVTCLATRE